MTKKVKAKVELPGYCKAGEEGKITDEYKESVTKQRMRIVKFKNGTSAVFGDLAFNNYLIIIK